MPHSFLTAPRWINTQTPYPHDQVLPTLITAWAERTPQRVAVACGSAALTWAVLESRANALAHALRAGGATPGRFIGLLLPRSLDLVVAQLAVLKTGAAFACFDPRYPRAALQQLLQSTPLHRLLTLTALANELPETAPPRLCLEDPSWQTAPVASPLPLLATPTDPALLLFTSGSTGQPKVVLHTHRNLIARLTNNIAISNFTPESVFAQTSPISSIDALDEIFIPLLGGGQTVIVPYETVIDPPELSATLATFRVTHLLLVPSLLRVLVAAAPALPQLRNCIVGGEPLVGALAQQFYACFPQAVLFNYYGLTEGDACCHQVQPAAPYPDGVPIGCPVRNTRLYLLHADLTPVEDGELGEIALAGAGLFREYLGRPDLNESRWQPNPFEPGTRLFLTGDLGRIRQGELEYAGRRDRMVKVRGFRVELGEVEAALLQHPAVQECVVAAKLVNEQTRLVAYVVLQAAVAPRELLTYAAQHLADFATPNDVMVLLDLPLSPNGKVDVAALPAPPGLATELPENYRPPRNPLEARLVTLWEHQLQRQPVGVEDDFFDLGGTSLMAINLVLAIKQEFGHTLPISALMQAPTIAALAGLLTADTPAVAWSSLVPIRPTGPRPPLFCLHADGGVMFYYKFARQLPPGLPIYGLQARGLVAGQLPHTDVPTMAADYIREMQTVQPHGPYHLVAYSLGGVVSLEIANQLRALGEPVALVGLLDAYGPGYPQLLPKRNLAQYKLGVHLTTLRANRGLRKKLNYLWRRVKKRSRIISDDLFGRVLTALHQPLPHHLRYNYVAKILNEIVEAHRPVPYPGPVTLFRATLQPENIVPDPRLGWQPYAVGEFRLINVPGSHNSIMNEPHLGLLVTAIVAELDRLHALPNLRDL